MKHFLLLLSICLISATAFPRQTIKGKVTGTNGNAIVGASVYEKGSINGTITDFNGDYSIEIDKGKTLVISFIGYLSQEIVIEDQTTLDVILEEDNREIEQVVVIGYGTQKKGDVTGSVGQVKKDDFIQGSVKDAGQLVQGKVAGLIVTNPSGNPMDGTSIALRGNTTINGTSTNPLVLIDGVPGQLNTVAPEDIESIDVLKDGSAAAIYGSRGTNGVIFITTKKAKGDNINQVEYSSYITTQTIAKKLHFCTAQDYRNQIAAGLRDASWDLGDDTDWLDEITRTPISHVHNLNFIGGNQTTNYVMNINYRNLQGIMEKSDKKEFQGRAEVNHQMFNGKLKFNLGLIGNQQNWTATADGGSWNGYTYRQALIQNPTQAVVDENGDWTQNTALFEYENPVSRLEECDGKSDVSETRYSGSIIFNPIKSVTLKALGAYNKTHSYSGYYETKNHISTLRDTRNGYAAVGSYSDVTKMAELTAQWQKTFGDHNISVLGGYSYQMTDYSNHYEQNWDFPTDYYSYNNIGAGQALKDGEAVQYSYSIQTNLIGFFSRVNYSFKERYLLMGAIRYEEASQLAGTDNPWGLFPSVSAGWIISQEPFMENVEIINNLKLRAGYGITGTQPSASYLGYNMLTYGTYMYYNGKWIQCLVPSQNANPDITWEEKHEYNVGLDFSLLKDRISGSIDVYNRTIKGLLYQYTVPVPPNMYNTTTANVGEMSNKGIEVMVSDVPVKKNDFEWTSVITFSTNKNKIESLSNDLYTLSTDYIDCGWIQEPVKTASHIARIGESIGQIYGFKVVDIDEDGKWIYEDKDGNLVGYDEFDHSYENKKVLGNGLPKYYLGFTNTFRYKKWDCTISMRGAFDFQIINSARMFYETTCRQDWNCLQSAFDKIYGKAMLSSECAQEFNSYYVEDGDYWKIDNLTIGYSFGSIGKYIKGLRLYVSSNNLACFTGYKGVDPEVSISGLNPGYDNRDQYPSVRSFSFGLNANF